MKWDLSQLEISNDGNLNFMTGDLMKKVHMVSNRSLANPTSTDKIVPSSDMVMVLECIF